MRVLCLLSCLIAMPASAATLRPLATINAPVVRLSDLFEDAGANAAHILGPGPAPGGRIVVEAPQLAAIARQFGVAWQPASSADRVVLDRPGKPLPRTAVLEALRAALAGAGVGTDSEIDAPTPSLPLIPFDAQSQPVVTRLDHDGATGGFVATLAVGGPEMGTVHLRVSGRVHETAAVPVASRRLLPGEVIRADDLREQRVRSATLRGDVALVPRDAIGLTLRAPLAAGQPIRLADLARPPAVRKGDSVQLLLAGGGLSLTGQGLALEAAATGERVRVRNPSSQAVIEGTVIAVGQVRVSPDSLPLRPPAGTLGQVVLR